MGAAYPDQKRLMKAIAHLARTKDMYVANLYPEVYGWIDLYTYEPLDKQKNKLLSVLSSVFSHGNRYTERFTIRLFTPDGFFECWSDGRLIDEDGLPEGWIDPEDKE